MRVQLILFLFIFIVSCGTVPQKSFKNEATLFATSWFQNSGESRALFYQGYYTATEELKKELKARKKAKAYRKPLAVVLDLDETVLDNSPYNAGLLARGESYPKGWSEWCAAAKAKSLPGAKEFLDFANSNNVEIFYVSNRDEAAKEATIKNLEQLLIPVKAQNVRLKVKSSGKEERRLAIAEKFNVVLFMGDNLNDFSDKFEKLNAVGRKNKVDELRGQFGPLFIAFPNPMYGDWEGAVYEYNWKQGDAEKNQKHQTLLEAF